LRQFQKLRFVLRLDVNLPISKQHRYLTQNIVVAQLSEAFVGSSNRRFVGSGLCLFRLKFLLLLLKLLLVSLQLLLVLLNLLVRRSQTSLDVLRGLQVVAMESDLIRYR
jgi:hypothetical protein